jgi:hypothetical protein
MGFSSHATKTLKSNRALLKKRRSFTELRKEYGGYVGDTQVNFKQLTDFEQKKLKDKIRARAKRDQLKELYAYVLAIFVLLCSFYGFYRFFK